MKCWVVSQWNIIFNSDLRLTIFCCCVCVCWIISHVFMVWGYFLICKECMLDFTFRMTSPKNSIAKKARVPHEIHGWTFGRQNFGEFFCILQKYSSSKNLKISQLTFLKYLTKYFLTGAKGRSRVKNKINTFFCLK